MTSWSCAGPASQMDYTYYYSDAITASRMRSFRGAPVAPLLWRRVSAAELIATKKGGRNQIFSEAVELPPLLFFPPLSPTSTRPAITRQVAADLEISCHW